MSNRPIQVIQNVFVQDQSQKTQINVHKTDIKQNIVTTTNIKINIQESRSEFDDLQSNSTHVFHGILNKLVENLTVEDALLNFLMLHKVLSQSQYEKIKLDKNTDTDKAVLLLNYVSKKGDGGLAKFMLGLFKHDHKFVVDIIVKEGLIPLRDDAAITNILDIIKNDDNLHSHITQLLKKNNYRF